MLHMPGAFPFFSRFNAVCTSSSDGGAHEIAGSTGAVLAALTRSSDSGAGGRFSKLEKWSFQRPCFYDLSVTKVPSASATGLEMSDPALRRQRKLQNASFSCPHCRALSASEAILSAHCCLSRRTLFLDLAQLCLVLRHIASLAALFWSMMSRVSDVSQLFLDGRVKPCRAVFCSIVHFVPECRLLILFLL